MEKYEQPGVKINSKPPSKEYKDNYDAIFGKKESWLDKREREQKRQVESLDRVNKLAINSFVKGRKEEEASCLDAEYERQAVKEGLNSNPIFEENIDLLKDMEAEMQEKIKHDNCTDN